MHSCEIYIYIYSWHNQYHEIQISSCDIVIIIYTHMVVYDITYYGYKCNPEILYFCWRLSFVLLQRNPTITVPWNSWCYVWKANLQFVVHIGTLRIRYLRKESLMYYLNRKIKNLMAISCQTTIHHPYILRELSSSKHFRSEMASLK